MQKILTKSILPHSNIKQSLEKLGFVPRGIYHNVKIWKKFFILKILVKRCRIIRNFNGKSCSRKLKNSKNLKNLKKLKKN